MLNKHPAAHPLDWIEWFSWGVCPSVCIEINNQMTQETDVAIFVRDLINKGNSRKDASEYAKILGLWRIP